MTLAQKIAFQLHYKGLRGESKTKLKEIAVKEAMRMYSKDEARTAVEELIDPCNILVPMTEDGEFGFGHLRYQEHLAAKELLSNRGIKISPFLDQSWWHGTLILFSQMNTNLIWLFPEIHQK